MKPTNKQMSEQLSVSVSEGQIRISIGIALLAYAVQTQDRWPEEFYVSDIPDFAKSIVTRLRAEEEDGTTLVHRMFDIAAEQVVDQGDDGVDEGDVEAGIDAARSILDDKAAST